MNGRRGSGEGSIFQRQDGRWVGQMDAGIVSGRRRYRLVYGKTRKDVAERLTKLLRERDTGTLTTSGPLTIATYLRSWLADAKGTIRPSTLRTYGVFVAHVTRELGSIRLDRLQPADVRRMMRSLEQRGLAPMSVKHSRDVLRTALAQAIRDGLLSRNAAALAKPPEIARTQVTSLTPDEARTFLASLSRSGDRLEALYRVALALGLRKGEALGLRWQDVDLDGRLLRVVHALQRVEGRLILVQPKTRRSARTVPLPDVVLDSLHAHRQRQLEERLLAGGRWHDTGHVFTSTIGTPLDDSDVSAAFHAALSRAGLRSIRFHDLRHSCASLLLAQGVPARVVMEILGHSTIALTMNVYSHVMPSLLGDAADAMDRVLG